jgi:uroporphyrinogen decarboxylase
VYEAVAQLRRALPAEVALIGFAGAPWTVALYMVEGRGGTDGSMVRRWAYGDPDGFGRLMERLTVATIDYLGQQIDHGADAVQIFDSWAGVLGEEGFRRWVIEPTCRIVAALRERHPQVPVIGYPRQAGVLYRDFVDATGVDGISCDALVPLHFARKVLQSVATVQGNLDNVLVLTGGDLLEQETRRLLDTLGRGRFIVNLGHGVLPETPPEHLRCVADMVKQWSAR